MFFEKLILWIYFATNTEDILTAVHREFRAEYRVFTYIDALTAYRNGSKDRVLVEYKVVPSVCQLAQSAFYQ